jgi:hypothetical protein
MMKFASLLSFLPLSALFISNVNGQAFGVSKKRQPGASFQELNEQAKKAASAGGMGDMDSLMKQMGINPEEMQKWAAEAGGLDLPNMDEMMKMMADMNPEELAKQMQDAMELLGGDDMFESMLGQQDEILQMLEETGAVDAEELAKFKTDPEYFQQKMKESMDQMKDMLANPDMMAQAAEGMKAAQDLYNNPDAMNEMMANLVKDLSDEDIESVRTMLLGGDGDPMMKELLGSLGAGEMEEALQDPVLWRKTVKEGIGMLGGQGDAGNKIVGEL